MSRLPQIARDQAQRHEALVLHLESLLKQVAAIAARRPEARIPEASRIAAEALLFDCRPFLPRGSLPKFPVAAPDHAGLATQLGQALAGLLAYEACHSHWSASHNGFVWRLGDQASLPIARLRPKLPASVFERQADVSQTRNKVARLIDGKLKAAFAAGRAAALAEREAADQTIYPPAVLSP